MPAILNKIHRTAQRWSQHAITYLIGFFIAIGSMAHGLSDAERRTTLQTIVKNDELIIPGYILGAIKTQAICVDKFDKSLASLDISSALKSVRAAEEFITKSTFHGLRPENINKNAHRGLVPFDATRTLRHIPGFYISASDILTPEQSYIAGEAPMGHTEEAFWTTIIEANVNTIVSLVTPQGDIYWKDNHFPRTVQGCFISKISEEETDKSPFFFDHRVVKRRFSIKKHGYTDRIVTHLHYENWPDRGRPDEILFHKLLERVEETHTDGTSPIFVHCAAGVGRSGAFITAHSLRADVRKLQRKKGPNFINVFQRILELRMQRTSMLKQKTQVLSVINAVRDAVYTSYLTQKKK